MLHRSPNIRPSLVLTLVFLHVSPIWGFASGETIERLEVHAEAKVGFVVTATVHLAASPAIVQEILTDYEHWPDLFSTTVRMARIERFPDRTVTNIYIKHGFLTMERRLLCENRELPGGGLTTTMLEGDFRHYSRTWHLSSDGSTNSTRGEFRLEVDVDTFAPNWLVATMLKKELESHFEILKTRTEQRTRQPTGR